MSAFLIHAWTECLQNPKKNYSGENGASPIQTQVRCHLIETETAIPHSTQCKLKILSTGRQLNPT